MVATKAPVFVAPIGQAAAAAGLGMVRRGPEVEMGELAADHVLAARQGRLAQAAVARAARHRATGRQAAAA